LALIAAVHESAYGPELTSPHVTTPLFLTSRIPETEAYRSDRFEVGFGFATRNRLAVGRTWNGRESFSYPHPGAAAHPYRKLALFHQVVPATDDKIAQAIPCNPCKLFKEGPRSEQSSG
jgi:hypothetical protein